MSVQASLSEPGSVSSTRMKQVALLVAGAMFMENLDGTIIATALPAMARSFGRPAVDLNIGISAYLLALGIFIPASGWVADRFGTRRVFALAIAIFTLASVLCGLSGSLPMFVAMRVLQGLGGAMMVPVGRLVVLRNTPKSELIAAMATLVWPALIAPVLGPPLGGFITDHANWRWIFYLNVPLGIVALLLTWMLIPDIRAASQKPFDWRGFVLCGVGIGLLLTGLEQIVAHLDANSLATVAVGVVVLVIAVRHLRRSPAPMVDVRSSAIPTFRVALLGGSLFRMAVGSAPFLLPLMFQDGFGYSAERSGLLMLGVFVSNLLLKTVTTPLIRRFGFRPILLVNGVLCAATLAACFFLTPSTPLLLTVAVLVAGGMTRSMQFTTIGSIAFADVPQAGMPSANGLFNTVSQLSMGAGIALGAIAIRLGHGIAGTLGLTAAGIDYRIAFVIVALVCLAGLIDVVGLRRGAGDHLARR